MRNVRAGLMAAVIGVLAAMPSMGRAESFANRVPADAVAYFQWAGTDALGSAYSQSHAHGLLATLDLQKALEKLVATHAAKAHPDETDAQRQAREQMAEEWIATAWKTPTAVYVGPVDFSDPEKPGVKIAIFSKVGNGEAMKLAKEMNDLHEQLKKPTDPPVAAIVVNDFLLVTIGADVDVEKRLGGAGAADGLAGVEAYTTAMSKVETAGTESAASFYGNGEAALHLVDDAIASNAGAAGGGGMNGPAQQWPKMEGMLGFDQIKQIAFAGNFDGADWSTRAFIGLTEKRSGLVNMLDNPPLPPEAYALIPAAATWAGVTRFDGVRFLDDMRNAMGEMGGSTQREFDYGMQQFFAWTGVNLKDDLLASLGDAFMFYGMPDAAGKSLNNLTMATKLRDADKAEKALSTLESVIGAMIGQRDPNSKIQFKTEPLAAPNDKTMAHMVPLGTFSPTWAVANGVLYFSLDKQGVESAIAAAGKTTIMDNATFAGMMKKTGRDAVSTFNYADMAALVPELYTLAGNALEEQRIKNPDKAPDYTLPPLAAIVHDLTPALSETWADKDGWHLKAAGPFFGAGSGWPTQVVVQLKIKEEKAKSATTEPAGGAGGAGAGLP